MTASGIDCIGSRVVGDCIASGMIIDCIVFRMIASGLEYPNDCSVFPALSDFIGSRVIDDVTVL